METETLTLNDGTVLENSSMFRMMDRIIVYIRNGDGIRTAFDLLIDPEKTIRIIRKAPGIEEVYEGYTRLISITDDMDCGISAALIKQ